MVSPPLLHNSKTNSLVSPLLHASEMLAYSVLANKKMSARLSKVERTGTDLMSPPQAKWSLWHKKTE